VRVYTHFETLASAIAVKSGHVEHWNIAFNMVTGMI